jgi:predicted Zn-ribbon and HTH transcriptional regulator
MLDLVLAVGGLIGLALLVRHLIPRRCRKCGWTLVRGVKEDLPCPILEENSRAGE